MTTKLCSLFKKEIGKTLPNAEQQEVLQNILESTSWEDVTENQFFVQVKNSLKMSIHLIEIEPDNNKNIDNYQYYCFGSTDWTKSKTDEILNIDQFIVLFKFYSKYYFFKTFTKTSTPDEKIIAFLKFDCTPMVEIGVNLLMKNLKSPKLRFLCQQLNVFCENSFEKNLFEIFAETDRNDTIEFLLQNECNFPWPAIAKKIPQVEEKLKLNEEFHDFIREENFEAIKSFLDKYRNLQYIINVDNDSACKVAIKNEKYKIYSLLFERGLTVKNDESYLLTRETFLDYFRNEKLPYEKYFDKQLQILASTTFTVNKLETDLTIDDIYNLLKKIPRIEPLLKVLFNVKPLFIIVDYKEESISKISPYGNEYTRGLFDPQMNRIFVSGGGGTEQLLATLAHEITHFTMNLLYENNARPYSIDDDNRQKRYNEIVEDTRQKVKDGRINEKIISLVFKYNTASWHAELIVRVNHILAFYGEKKGTLILQELTPTLLRFYDEILLDLEKYQRSHVNRNENIYIPPFLKAIEINCNKYNIISKDLLALITQTSRHVVLETEYVELTCLKLFSNMTKKDSQFTLNNTYMIDLLTVCADTALAFSYFQNYKLIIVADDTFEKQCNSNEWDRFKNYVNGSGKRFIFVVGEKKTVPFKKVSVIYTDVFQWTNFDVISQELIFNKFEVNFLGQRRKLNSLIGFKKHSLILNSVFSAEVIKNLIFSQSIPTVGTTPLSLSNYINRVLVVTLIHLNKLVFKSNRTYLIENISEQLAEKDFALPLSSGKSFTFPGKKLAKIIIDKYLEPMEAFFETDKTLGSDFKYIENAIIIISFPNNVTSRIRIGVEKKEILVDNFTFSDLQKLYENNNDFNIHWFMYTNGNYYILKTFGSLDRFRNNMMFSCHSSITELHLFNELDYQKVLLIAATAGMGKTSTLKNLAKRLVENSSTWAAVVILIESTEILETYDSQNTDPDYILEFLAKLLQYKSNFEKELFKCCLQKKDNNMYIFFDGADEISPTHTEKMIQLINHLSTTNIKHIIISVRQNLKSEFENRLNTFAIEIQPLTNEEQNLFMRNIWRATDNKIHNVEEIVTQIVDHFGNMKSLFNSPLQIFLTAEICKEKLPEFSEHLEKVKEYFDNELTLMEMYKKFIELKLKIAVEEKIGCRSSIPAASTLAIMYMQETIRQLRHASVITLLPAEDVNLFLKTDDINSHNVFIKKIKKWETYEGIVDGIFSEKLNFVHQTYADYLFADFLINQCEIGESKERECFFFERILTEEKYAVVRKFLNSFKENLNILVCKPKHFQIPATPHKAISQNFYEQNSKIFQHLLTVGFDNTVTFSPKHGWASLSSDEEKDENFSILKRLVSTNCNVLLPINSFCSIRMNFDRENTFSPKEWLKKLFKCELQFVKPNIEPLYARLLDPNLLEKINLLTSIWNEAQTMAEQKDADSTKLVEYIFSFLHHLDVTQTPQTSKEKLVQEIAVSVIKNIFNFIKEL